MWKNILYTLAVCALSAACETTGVDGGGPAANDPSRTTPDTSDDTGTEYDTDSFMDGGSGTDPSDGDAGPGMDSETGEDNCAAAPYDIVINPINMLIVLDRSRSMLDTVSDGGLDFATITQDAINDLVLANEGKGLINFGLNVFPSLSCKCIGDICPEEYTCVPAGSIESGAASVPLVEIGPNRAAEIAIQLASAGTCGGTPICKSLEWAKAYLADLPSELAQLPTYVLLATDGAPNCNTGGNPGTCDCTLPNDAQCWDGNQCLDDVCSMNQAAQLKNGSVNTFVIGVGDEAAKWEPVMNGIAQSGGTGTYYPANNPTTLQAALENIINTINPCTFEVPWASVPVMSDNGPVHKACNKVKVIGAPDKTQPVSNKEINYSWDCSDQNGWRFKGLDKELKPDEEDTTPLDQCSTIELCADSCDKLRKRQYEQISATFGCAPTTVY